MPARLDLSFTIRSVEDIEAVIAECRRLPAYRRLSDVTILRYLGVCPVPLFDAFTFEVLRLYRAIEAGLPWPWPGTFYDQPAVFARAHEVLAGEFSLIRKEDAQRSG